MVYLGSILYLYYVIVNDIVNRGGRVLRISSDGDDRRIFLGLKFLIPEFLWVGKSGRNFFGWLDLKVGIFGGIQNNLKIRGSTCVSQPLFL